MQSIGGIAGCDVAIVRSRRKPYPRDHLTVQIIYSRRLRRLCRLLHPETRLRPNIPQRR